MREIRRKTKAVGVFPDGNSVLMLAATRLRHTACAPRWRLENEAILQYGTAKRTGIGKENGRFLKFTKVTAKSNVRKILDTTNHEHEHGQYRK